MSLEKYKDCIEACNICMVTCEWCASQCLKEEDVKKMVPCIETDLSCADACGLASREMARGSDFVNKACALCAEICEACAQECAKHKMEHCQECAEACRRAAQECRRMAA